MFKVVALPTVRVCNDNYVVALMNELFEVWKDAVSPIRVVSPNGLTLRR